MPRQVVWAEAARSDLLQFVTHLEREYPMTAMKVALEIDESANKLAELPMLGVPMRDNSGRREFYTDVKTLRFVIRYHLGSDQTIRILRIWHASSPRSG